MTILVDQNNRPIGNQKNDPPAKDSPDREILRILRILEASYRTGLPDTCATLDGVYKAGWGITFNPELQDGQAEAVIIMKLRRDANNKLKQYPERWIALGKGYVEALAVLKEHADKEAMEKTAKDAGNV